MDARELRKLGVPGFAMRKFQQACGKAAEEYGYGKDELKREIGQAIKSPDDYSGPFEEAARKIDEAWNSDPARDEPRGFEVFGTDLIYENAKEQMEWAMRLDVAEKGALMPDAHLGYGLPVGGVLATKNCIIPGAVGVDIACRMKLSIFDVPYDRFSTERLVDALKKHTRFGVGAHFEREYISRRRYQPPIVYESRAWKDLEEMIPGFDKDYALAQLGSSGGGNHFVEFGRVGDKLALLSHSGSRGAGYKVSKFFMEKAKEQHPEFEYFDYPETFNNLAWLDIDSEWGKKYWRTMNFMADYAEACHRTIHRNIAGSTGRDFGLGVEITGQYENHHNLAFKEEINGEEYFVHRKGATPAKAGEFGIIPATMDEAAKIVVGTMSNAGLNSAAHGCGRFMSRREAKRRMKEKPQDFVDVELIGGGRDEHPRAYKNIDKIMKRQTELVKEIGEFEPMVVRMAED